MLKPESLWSVGKWEGLWPGCDCLSGAEKVTESGQILQAHFMDNSNFTSCCLWHSFTNLKLGQGPLGVMSTLLQFCGILAIRGTRRVRYCGTVNV